MLFVSWTRLPSIVKFWMLPFTTSALDEPSVRFASSLSTISTPSNRVVGRRAEHADPVGVATAAPLDVVPMSWIVLSAIRTWSAEPVTRIPIGTCPDWSLPHPVIWNPWIVR